MSNVDPVTPEENETTHKCLDARRICCILNCLLCLKINNEYGAHARKRERPKHTGGGTFIRRIADSDVTTPSSLTSRNPRYPSAVCDEFSFQNKSLVAARWPHSRLNENSGQSLKPGDAKGCAVLVYRGSQFFPGIYYLFGKT